jgi:hypothetical protein
MSAGDAMTPSVAPSDLGLAAAVCRRALDPLVDRDWTVRAGDLV